VKDSREETHDSLQAILQSLPVLVTLHAADGVGTYTGVYTGRQVKNTSSSTELIGAQLGDVLNETATEILLESIEETIETESIQYAEFPVSFGGEQFWRGAYIAPLDDEHDTTDEVVMASFDQSRQKGRQKHLYDILTVLAEQTSRTDVERAFCEQLVEQHRYAMAWIGSSDRTGTVTIRSTANAEAYLDDLRTACGRLDSTDDPGVRAVQSGDSVSGRVTETPTEDWVAVADEHDVQCAFAVPLSHGGIDHGVLAVYATDTEYLVPWRMDVLRTCAEGIGYALTATMWRWAHTAEPAAVIDITIRDPFSLLGLCATAGLDALAVDGVVPRTGETVYYLTVPDENQQALAAGVEELSGMEMLAAPDEQLVLVVGDEFPAGSLAQCGVRVRDCQVTPEDVHFTMAAPSADSARTAIDCIQEVYPNVSVSIKWDQPDETLAASVSTDPIASLTDRQYEVLAMAYNHGYFERDSQINQNELADLLDLSRWTVSEHLRAAQHNLLSELLD
jgi:DNA-binding CsgD family transcriptional regulator